MPKNSKHSKKSNSHRSRPSGDGSEKHRIDLKPDSPAIRQIEHRQRVRWGFHAAVCLLVVFALVALVRATIREAFVNNPRFSLRHVMVNTDGSLTPQKIVKQTGLTEGQNLLTINLSEVRERIEQLPQVRLASIAKDLQGGLRIDVIQRHPVAWIECGKLQIARKGDGTGWLADAEGVAVPCESEVRDYRGLPVIRCDELPQVVAGARVQSQSFAAALRLLAEIERRFDDDQLDLKRIDLANRYALTANFSDGMAVTFGIDDLGEQLARWDHIKREARQRGWKIATLNLLAGSNIPVTFRGGSPSPVAATESGRETGRTTRR